MKKGKLRKLTSLALISVLVGGLFGGCSSNKSKEPAGEKESYEVTMLTQSQQQDLSIISKLLI